MRSARIPLDFTFQPRRVLALVRNQLAFQWKSLATAVAALAGTYLFLYVCTVAAGRTPYLMESIWGAFVLLTGWVMAAGAFSDVHRSARSTWWFLLPASILEKYVATVLLVLTALLIGFPLLGLASDLVSRGLTLVLWNRDHLGFDPFNQVYWWCAATGLALMPVFFFGSTVFRKLAFFKTLLAFLVFFVVLVLVLLGLGWLFFGELGFSVDRGSLNFGTLDYQGLPGLGHFFEWALPVLFFGVVPAFFLVAGFLRLTESEVDHGIS